MVDKKNKTSPAKRTLRTPEERLAAAEAEVERIKALGTAKDRKRHAVLSELYAKYAARVEDFNAKMQVIGDEIAQIEERVPDLSAQPANTTPEEG